MLIDQALERENEEEEPAMGDQKLKRTASLLILLSDGKKSCEFECKTCKRSFATFQALGGHRAGHRRDATVPQLELKLVSCKMKRSSPAKLHKCAVCGLKFELGQALGGHMRRHRLAAAPTEISLEKKGGVDDEPHFLLRLFGIDIYPD